MITLQKYLGADGATETVTLLDGNGEVVTIFTGSELLTCSVWGGDDQVELATLPAVWLNAATGDIDLQFPRATLTTLGAGQFRWQLKLADLSATLAVGSLEVLHVAGTGAALKTYCTYNDMQIECAWIGQFFNPETDVTDFAEQRARARDWMDGLILRAQPITSGTGLVSRQNYWTWQSRGGSSMAGNGLALDRVLMGYLAADGLILTTPQGKSICRSCACYAVSLVLRSQPGNANLRMADYYGARADQEACATVAEIDTNSDGLPDYAIALGITNTRYG